MPDIIQLLPDSVANQIAAGEVIQRPASVIKELVENAIDAGADNIRIILKDAGKTLIQVVDNGCGMSTTDARMAFERHATSKIRKADDLFTLHTMGFRGEALPSIAAVAEVELQTMRREDKLGTRLIIRGSKFESQEPCVCTQGTNIMVKHLFYNFVARRRFLKKDAQEMTHILHEFERLALVNTNVQFRLTHNDTLLHQLPRSPLKQRIGNLFGKTVEQNMIPIATTTSVASIDGFVSLPSAARKRGALQYFFVNGRNMRHPYFHRAVLNCFKDLIAADAQPNYFINFTVDPSRIDVNIHPQKHEIKFEDEQLVFQILSAAIKESLGKFNVAPAIDFNATDVPDIPPCVDARHAPDKPVSDDFDPTYDPFASTLPESADNSLGSGIAVTGFGFGNTTPETSTPHNIGSRGTGYRTVDSALNRNWDKLYDSFMSAAPKNNDTGSTPSLINRDAVDLSVADLSTLAEHYGFNPTPLQIKGRYILLDCKDGVMVIDQHRAHTRTLYESILSSLISGNLHSQYLLIDEPIDIDPVDAATLADNIDRLRDIGFIVNVSETQTTSELTAYTLSATPSILQPSQALATLHEIIGEISDQTDDDSTSHTWQQRVALSLARATAMRGVTFLNNEQITQLLTDLFRLTTPNLTPDNLPTFVILSISTIISPLG